MSSEESKFDDFEKGLVSLYKTIYGKDVNLSTSGDEEFQLALLLSKSSNLNHQRARDKLLLMKVNNEQSLCQDQRDELNERVNESSIFSSTPSSTSPNNKRQLVEDAEIDADSTEFQVPPTYKKIFYSPNKSKSSFNDENSENLYSDNSPTKIDESRIPLSPIIYRSRSRSNNSNNSQFLSKPQSQPSPEEEEELITVDEEEDQDSSLSLLTSREQIKTNNKPSTVTTTAANSSSSSSSQNSQGNRSLFLSYPSGSNSNSSTKPTQKKKKEKQTAGNKWYFKTVLSPSESHLKQPTLKEMARKAPPQMIDLMVIRELHKSDSEKAKEGFTSSFTSSSSKSSSNELAVTEEFKGKGKANANVVLQSGSGQLNKTPPNNTSSNSEETLIKDILNEFQINSAKKTTNQNKPVTSVTVKPQPQPPIKAKEAVKSARVSDSKLQVAIIDKRNKIAIDFDEPTPKPSNSPTYAYVPKKAIRGKKERAKLEGWDCDVCVEYYKAIESQLGEDKIKELQNKCSKHRSKYPYRNANTPPGYWRTDFPSTQSCRDLGIGYYGQDSSDEDV